MEVLVLLAAAGLAGGFIDSIAGGGGLVTLPALSLALGTNASAVASNKVGAVIGTSVALCVFARGGHLQWKKTSLFSAWVATGSLLGSRIAPLLPGWTFRWFLFVTCPLILWVVFRRELWVASSAGIYTTRTSALRKRGMFAASGLACGLYDGAWGPGGGTFMLLSLVFAGRLPLLGAMGGAKLANLASAAVSLGSYTQSGYVQWTEGIASAAGLGLGSLLGALWATRRATQIVRPILVVVVALLMIKLVVSQWS